MSSPFEISLAAPGDDDELRALYAGSAAGGALSLVYKREPSFFYALDMMGEKSQVLVGRREGRIIGMGCITFFRAYVQGAPQTIGYLHSLRVVPAFRKSLYLARGYQHLSRLSEDHGVPFYISTVIEDNRAVVRLFQKQRSFMPRYQDRGRYITYVIPFLKKRKRNKRWEIQGVSGSAVLAGAVDWMQQWGSSRELYPVFDTEVVRDSWMKSYGLQDILVAHDRGRIVGTLGMWDQRSFKQTVVGGYHGRWRLIKPLYNMLAGMRGASPLPDENKAFKYLFASFPTAANNDPGILRELLEELYERARAQGYAYCVIGLHEQEPLSRALADFFTLPYASRVYRVSPQEEPCCDVRAPYLELARL
ncbi:MAG: GNAT family N-acetyltransferase [Pseudomonadota bacterium]